MKKLRNFYLIIGLAALAFAMLAKFIPGVTITDFVYGFCHGLGITALLAGVVAALIPHLCRKDKAADKKQEAENLSSSPSTSHSPSSPSDPETPLVP